MGATGWCRTGADQAACHQFHSWGKLPAGPNRSKDRACPACGANLSINPGDRGMWLVWTCHGGCDGRAVRDELEKIIAPECLGSYESDQWRAKQQCGVTPYPNRADPATLAGARRSYAYQKLIGSDLAHASLLKMCMQAISESDGDVAGDPALLLPRDFKEFIALAKRTGVERRYRYKLAHQWLGDPAA